MSKGILERLMEAPQVEYTSRGITIEEMKDIFVDLSKYKPRKPHYILSKWEAENLPLWQLTWMGENYMVTCSLEVSNIVKQRESEAAQ